MKQFFEFIINHWLLWSLFILIVIVILLDEIRKKAFGIPKLDPQALTQLINREDAIVIDLRDSNAFLKGHIINALNIPHTQLDNNIEKLKKYQDKPIVIVCSSGQTAIQEGIKLKNKGFEKIYYLAGGMQAWQGVNFPLIKG